MVGRWVGLLAVLLLALVACAQEPPAQEPPPPKPPQPFWSDSFEDADLHGRGWYDGREWHLSDIAREGEHSLEFSWLAGTMNSQTHGGRRPVPETEQVYVRFCLRLSDNWRWSPRPYHPHLAHFMTTEDTKWQGPAFSRLTLYIEPVGGRLRLATQDRANQTAPHGLTQGPLRGGYNGQEFDSEEVLFEPGRWYLVEALFRLNTVDEAAGTWASDGLVQGWVDGELVIDRDDVIFRSVDYPTMKFNQFLLTPYFGEGLLPHPQTLWIDNLLVAGERIEPEE